MFEQESGEGGKWEGGGEGWEEGGVGEEGIALRGGEVEDTGTIDCGLRLL